MMEYNEHRARNGTDQKASLKKLLTFWLSLIVDTDVDGR